MSATRAEARRPPGGDELDPVLVHVGYHKTGTTWLQRELFPSAAVGFAMPLSKKDEIPHALVFPNPLDFDPGRAREQLYPPLLEAGRAGLVPVLSSERLVGPPHSGGYDSKELAERIAAVFPRARVLMMIREQRDMVLTTYKNYVTAGGPARLRDYLSPPVRGAGRMPSFDLAHFEYHRLIERYRALLGPERVLALPYELLRTDPAGLVARIASFCSLEPSPEALAALPYEARRNRAPSGFAIEMKRLLNPVFSRDRLNPRPLIRLEDGDRVLRRIVNAADARAPARVGETLDRRMVRTVAEVVGDRYRESNRRTGELVGLALERYGYAV